ncbi:hypothetical protein E2C01_035246 [Portunus trituberculatus]|uniref:Uncharacterized protein n=1 Tax=Portunus trituberculatus TaxID=210409 RepID=A0A5B7F7U4_PORTR|nr:hypothetical protein [Portunus trituberculatus]
MGGNWKVKVQSLVNKVYMWQQHIYLAPLELVQNEAMRIILGCHRTARIEVLRAKLHLPSIDAALKMLVKDFYTEISDETKALAFLRRHELLDEEHCVSRSSRDSAAQCSRTGARHS